MAVSYLLVKFIVILNVQF